MKFKNSLLMAAVGLLSAFSVQAANVKIQAKEFLPTYTVIVLTKVPGVDLTLPAGIFTTELLTGFDDQGAFIGTVLGGTYDNPILIRNGKLIDVAPVVGNSYSNAINANGLAVGTYWNVPTQTYVAFSYNKQVKFTTFTPAADALETDGSSVNDIGQVARFFSPAGFRT